MYETVVEKSKLDQPMNIVSVFDALTNHLSRVVGKQVLNIRWDSQTREERENTGV